MTGDWDAWYQALEEQLFAMLDEDARDQRGRFLGTLWWRARRLAEGGRRVEVR